MLVFEMMDILGNAYPAAYQTLYEAKPITCSVTGKTFDAVPAPCAAVLDVSQSSGKLNVTVDGDFSILWLLFYIFTASFLPFLNYMQLEQSVGILCQ